MLGNLNRYVGVLIVGSALPLAAADVPRPAQEFVIQLPSGRQQLLSSFRGKVVALEFLLTTCPSCQRTSALMNRLYAEYGPRGFQPLGVAFNDGAQMLVPEYIRSLALNYPVGFAQRDPVFGFLQLSPIVRTNVPLLVLVDRKGQIRAQYAGGDPFFSNEESNLRAALESLLSETGRNGSGSRAAKAASRKKTGGR